MKKYIIISILISIFSFPIISNADTIDDDNHEVSYITREIKENGPIELRNLSLSTIRNSVEAFVFGRRSGAISPSQLARMGGVKKAAESSLMGQLKVLGGLR